jgi:hypothetical protein
MTGFGDIVDLLFGLSLDIILEIANLAISNSTDRQACDEEQRFHDQPAR